MVIEKQPSKQCLEESGVFGAFGSMIINYFKTELVVHSYSKIIRTLYILSIRYCSWLFFEFGYTQFILWSFLSGITSEYFLYIRTTVFSFSFSQKFLRLIVGSYCSIFSFLWSVVYIIVGHVLFLLVIVLSVLQSLRLLITSLVSSHLSCIVSIPLQ